MKKMTVLATLVMLSLALSSCGNSIAPTEQQVTTQVDQTGGNPDAESPVIMNATPAEGGPIDEVNIAATTDRNEVVRRAQTWVDARVPYNQGRYYNGYRQDCSGIISMAWNIGTSAVTSTLGNYANTINKDDLQPGDAINNRGYGNYGHVVMFKAWLDGAKTRFIALEENGGYGRAIQTTLTLVPKNGAWTIREYEPYAPGPYTFQRSRALAGGSGGGVVARAPIPQSPNNSADGNKAVSFAWTPASGANRLALYISKYPYGSSNLVYQNENIPSSAQNLALDPNAFRSVTETRYRWNMAWIGSDGSAMYSAALNFTLSTPTPPPPPQNQSFNSRILRTSNLAVNYNIPTGSLVFLWDLDGTEDQNWQFAPQRGTGNATQYLVRRAGTNMCLNAYQPSQQSTVNVYSCDGNDSDQLWQLIPQGGKVALLQLVNTPALCLNAYQPSQNSRINLYSCDASDSDQHFTLPDAPNLSVS